MLQNAYFLAKIGADTAENQQHFAEILEFRQNVWNLAAPARHSTDPSAPARGAGVSRPLYRMLVFGCIGTDFCKKICVLQHFSKSTRLSSWIFWNLQNSNFANFATFAIFLLNFRQKKRRRKRELLIFQTDFLRKFWDCSGAKGCKSCRAWKMLSNAYFLANIRFDTAENEPAKN